MKKFDNYIYFTICEITLKYFSTTYYSTYYNFCNVFKFSIQQNKLSLIEKHFLVDLSEDLELIYAIKEDKAGEYISNYFMNDMYVKFEKPVRYMKQAFPYSQI